MSSRASFYWVDYLIFGLMMLTSCAIGVYFACRAKTHSQAEYIMGGRKMQWFPVALSLVVSYISGTSQLGKPAEVYQYGIQYCMSLVGVTICIVIVTFTFLPMIYNLKLVSSYEYLELRFQSKAVRRVGSLIIILSQLLYPGLATYSPAIALEAVTDIPVWVSIICVGAAATFYTMLGGMKAVVWADAFQSVIMLAGMLAIVTFGILEVGGVRKMWTINQESGRINFFNFDPNPLVRMSFWSLTIGSTFGRLPFYAVNQMSVQRCCSVPTLKKAQMLLLMNIPLQFILDALLYIIGLIIFAYFSGCDPLRHPDPEHKISSPNQLVPLFVLKVLNWPGMPGVFLASIFSGSFSTVSSCLNALSAIMWEDFLKWKFDYLSEATKTNILKILVLLFGVCGCIFAFLATFLQGSVLQVSMSFLDTSSSPLMGLFILGAFFTKTNWLGAIAGGLIGLMFPMWISLGSYLAVPGTPPLNTSDCEGINKLYTISFKLFPIIGTFTTVIMGLLISAITAQFIKSVDPNNISDAYLISPLDLCRRKRKARMDKKNALDQNELTELTT